MCLFNKSGIGFLHMKYAIKNSKKRLLHIDQLSRRAPRSRTRLLRNSRVDPRRLSACYIGLSREPLAGLDACDVLDLVEVNKRWVQFASDGAVQDIEVLKKLANQYPVQVLLTRCHLQSGGRHT